MGAFLYLYTHPAPPTQPPPDAAGTWNGPPDIEAPTIGSSLPAGMSEFNPSDPPAATPPSGFSSGMSPTETSLSPFSATAPSDASSSGGAEATSNDAGPFGSPIRSGAAPLSDSASIDSGGSPDAIPDAAVAYAGLPADVFDGRTAPGGIVAGGPSTDNSAALTISSPAEYTATRRQVSDLLAKGDLGQALLLLTPWYKNDSLAASDARELDTLLSELAGTVIYSPNYHLEPPHTVAAGETLAAIAQSYSIPPELLANINSLAAGQEVHPGQSLKVLRGPFTAVVDLDSKEMALLVADRYAGRFPIGVGRDYPDMEGAWVVRYKQQDPPYYGVERTIYPGDPDNPLGKYWIALQHENDSSYRAPLGIHGTNHPERLQSDDPLGYIRLSPTDAKDAYEILSLGSPVYIRR